jgi:hypothetical protein
VGDGILHNVGLTSKGKLTSFSLRLSKMQINTKFVLKDGFLVPDFAQTSASSTEFSLTWYVPDKMKLYLMVTVDASAMLADDTWLVAFDRNGNCYRLPTTNTYEDGKVCQGIYDGYGTSLLDCLIKAYKQFIDSRWNADLHDRGGDYGMEHSMQLFRFKPLEPDGFDMVQPDKDWTLLAEKINSEFINNNIILV